MINTDKIDTEYEVIVVAALQSKSTTEYQGVFLTLCRSVEVESDAT